MASLWDDPAPLPEGDVTVQIPWTMDKAIALFLNRWCHRALGDREVADRELRELIAHGRRTVHDE